MATVVDAGCQFVHAKLASFIKELNGEHAHIRPLLEQCSRNVVGLCLSFHTDVGRWYFRGEQNPFTVTILGQRVERGLATHRPHRNHRQLSVKVNGALNDQRRERIHLCRQRFQRLGVAQ